MSQQKEPRQISLIKQEYLPPPLEQNYLSFFDIQVKMTKQFLTGTEQEKNIIIKKRIKKFFDYGNQHQEDLSIIGSTKKVENHHPFQVDATKIKQNLKFDCTKIILYSEESISFEEAEEIFPGFIGFQKIDDCNVKLSFSNQDECQKSLIKNSKVKNSLTIEQIKEPFEIEWFELQNTKTQEQPVHKYFARFVTNKDNILFGNDKYFRKLLGRARKLISKKQNENKARQKEIEQQIQFTKSRISRKNKLISKNYGQKKYRKDFDTQTNYEGTYQLMNRQKNYKRKPEPSQFSSKEQSFFCEYKSRQQKQYFNKLNISQVLPDLIQLEEYSNKIDSKKRDSLKLSSRDSVTYSDSSRNNNIPVFDQLHLRDRFIDDYNKRYDRNQIKKRCFELKNIDNKQLRNLQNRGLGNSYNRDLRNSYNRNLRNPQNRQLRNPYNREFGNLENRESIRRR